ncbi:alpha/beta fold hydrolase [Falsirhodobacter halotolerans]|uniref:alpha/beta fold hydrolase n=1 Tax=Falsirhodobacter halotolerans TaxID=1146892 RepID=UPI001FD5924D|nr:alpha/beta hydrolase [Falsirhodobacter halotolerans]MCJ8140337.1 alpha/beta hydrolase [Falsirhodobacter halotolerans]
MIALRTEDGVNIRAQRWEGGPDTVLILQGRSEYIEKYHSVIDHLQARGFSVVTFDWRGQGGSDRALADPMIGHVQDFDQYQRDLRAALTLVTGRVFVIAHSMGGCIALRWLVNGARPAAVAFSAPMWGLPMAGFVRPFAPLMAGSGRLVVRGHVPIPGLGAHPYVLDAPFAGNILTSDATVFERLREEARTMPDRMVGGPSLGWLSAALREMRALARMKSPAIPALAMVGSHERVVHVTSIRARMARWPGAGFTLLDGAEHEVMMEREPLRSAFLTAAEDLFRR